jgi:hypothetical protein
MQHHFRAAVHLARKSPEGLATRSQDRDCLLALGFVFDVFDFGRSFF